MIRTYGSLALVIVASIVLGCGSSRPPSLGMPDSTFVSTLTELRRIESDTSLDVTMRDSTRRLILRRHKVTAQKLEAAARILAESPALASDLWRQIESVPLPTSKPVIPAAPPTSAPGNNHPVEH